MKKQRLNPSENCCYEFELIQGENLKGVISSSSHIDIYLVTNTSFSKWMIGETFEQECCNESVIEAKIEFLAPKEGTWYLIIENNGTKTSKVEVMIRVSS